MAIAIRDRQYDTSIRLLQESKSQIYTKSWKVITLKYENQSNAHDCFIQLNSMNYNTGKLIVNSIKIERDANYVKMRMVL